MPSEGLERVASFKLNPPMHAHMFAQCASSGLIAVAGDMCEPDTAAPILLFHVDSPSEQVLLRLVVGDKPQHHAIKSLDWSPPGVETMLLVGLQDGRVFVYSMSMPDRGGVAEVNCCVFNEWHCHRIVLEQDARQLASAAWLSPPSHMYWPSRLARHRFGPDAPCGLHALFTRSEYADAEPLRDDEKLDFGYQEWIRPHVPMIAVVSQDAHVSVFWHGLSDMMGRLTWHATHAVRLNLLWGVPAADAHVASGPNGKLHVALVLHDYPDNDTLKEHVASTFIRGDLTCTTPQTPQAPNGALPGVHVKSPLSHSHVLDNSPVRRVALRHDELCHRVMLFTQQKGKPWQWALRCVVQGGASERDNAVLHSFDIDYASFDAVDPETLVPAVLGACEESEKQATLQRAASLDVAYSADGLLAAVLVTIGEQSTVVWVDIRNQVPPAGGTPVGTFTVLDITPLDWLPPNRDAVKLQFSPNGALLLLLVSHLELSSAMGLATRRNALHALRVPVHCSGASPAVTLSTMPTSFERHFVFNRGSEYPMKQAIREGVLLGHQLAWALVAEHGTWDLLRLLKWQCCVRGDGTALEVSLTIINDFLHATLADMRQRCTSLLDDFKAAALPFLLQPDCPEASALLVECLAVDARARRMCNLVASRLEQLSSNAAMVSHFTAHNCIAPAEVAIVKEKLQLQLPWVRWAELFLAALAMSLKQWLNASGDDAHNVPLIRLFLDDHITLKSLQVLQSVLKQRQRLLKQAPEAPTPWPSDLSQLAPDTIVGLLGSSRLLEVMDQVTRRDKELQGNRINYDDVAGSDAVEAVFPSFGLAHYCVPNSKCKLVTKFASGKQHVLRSIEAAMRFALPCTTSSEQMRANMALLGLSPFQSLPDRHQRLNLDQPAEPPLSVPKLNPYWAVELPGWKALNPRGSKPHLVSEIHAIQDEAAIGAFREETRRRALIGPDVITGVLSDVPPRRTEFSSPCTLGERGYMDLEALDGSCATNEFAAVLPEELTTPPRTVSQAVLRSCLASSPLTGAPWKRARYY